MSSIWVTEFTGGLDTRRLPETTSGGVLIKAQDGHITRGGEFEKRAAFVPVYNLPSGTHGLAAGKTSLTVFGNDPPPALPTGIAYQQLTSGPRRLNRVLSYDLYAGKIYAVGEFQDGTRNHYYDGVLVDAWYDGRARAHFYVTGGTSGSSVSNITVNGISIISGPISWTTSNDNTASLIADAINGYLSTPEYVAVSVANKVNIIANDPSAAMNGKTVVITLTGDFVIDPPGSSSLIGGADLSSTYQPGTFVRTIASQMHSVSGPNEYFSGIGQPTKWTTATTGAGFIDMSSQESGSENLIALAKYQQWVAIFAERVIQIWVLDPDQTNNKQAQVLNNTGTASPKSVTQFGDNDLFYLDESGVRSLRARDASNSAATTDIGVPVDTIITAKLQTLTQNEREAIIGIIEPREGRFWLIVKDEIYVFSFFNGAKVSAWSTYLPTDGITGERLTITDAVVFQRRIYLRSGDTIYAYGGVGQDLTYDSTSAEAWLPYLDGGAPARVKRVHGFDAAVQGPWNVAVVWDPINTAFAESVADIVRSTFSPHHYQMEGAGTHIALRFKSTGSGPAKLGSVMVHHVLDKDAD